MDMRHTSPEEPWGTKKEHWQALKDTLIHQANCGFFGLRLAERAKMDCTVHFFDGAMYCMSPSHQGLLNKS